MGSICSTDDTNETETVVVRRYDTGSLDLENHNPLLDQLVVERYKSGARINAKVRGFLFRKHFDKIKWLLKLKKKGNLETNIAFDELLPKSFSDKIAELDFKLREEPKFISLCEAYYKKAKEDNNANDLEEKNYYNSKLFFSGSINKKNLERLGYGKVIKFKTNDIENILNNHLSNDANLNEAQLEYKRNNTSFKASTFRSNMISYKNSIIKEEVIEENKVTQDNINNDQQENRKYEINDLPEIKSEYIDEVDVGFFENNKLVFGIRLFNPNNYYIGSFENDNNKHSFSGEGEYHNQDFCVLTHQDNRLSSVFDRNNNNDKKLSLVYNGNIVDGLFHDYGTMILTSSYSSDNVISDEKINSSLTIDSLKAKNSILFKTNMESLKETKNIVEVEDAKIDYELTYEGNFDYGVIFGRGKVAIKVLKNQKYFTTTINSDFNKNVINGFTEIFFPSGSIFNGITKDSLYEGRGKYIWNSVNNYNETYEGEYSKNTKSEGLFGFQYDSVKNYNNNEELKIIAYKGLYDNNLPEGDGFLYLNKVPKIDSSKKIKCSLKISEEELVLKANFYKGRLQRLIKQNPNNMKNFEDFEVIDKMIISHLKKEEYVNQSLIKCLDNVFSVVGI